MPDSKRQVTFNLEKTLESTGHSEDLVRRLVAEGDHSEDIHNKITKNTRHIEIILSRQEVIDSGSAKIADFQEAITLGEAFVAAE